MVAFSVLVCSVRLGFTMDHLSIFRRYYEVAKSSCTWQRLADLDGDPITRVASLLVMANIQVCL
jgi:hypothetical protein